MRFTLTLAALVVLAPSLAQADAGHGHGTTGHHHYDGHAAAMGEPGDPKARGIRTIEVTMTDEMRFRPAQIQVQKGQTVRFVVKNAGLQKHEFILGTPDELTKHAAEMEKFPEMEHDDPNAVSVEAGKTGELIWKFTKAGTWDVGFGCLLPGHFSNGMKGKLVVR
jgi:uncharacterized cupredoxin-like copper-binding protein